MDKERIERAVREILYAIGDDPQREGLLDTPKRVAKAYEEMFSGLASDPFEVLGTVFHENYRDIVMVRNIEVSSFCEHHLLPFRGTASIGYLPAKEGGVVGLSKLARLVEVFARRPQVQERLTTQIADALEAALDAEGVIVEIECEHSCMSFRGVKKSGSTTVTSTLRGVFRDDPQQQAMVLNLLRGGNKS
ncbi:GTP cyclohydrolase I FolE [Photobacterium galatheae]|nr:GTP cyclohydrolase I FolE [Photobacterium galatheae]